MIFNKISLVALPSVRQDAQMKASGDPSSAFLDFRDRSLSLFASAIRAAVVVGVV